MLITDVGEHDFLTYFKSYIAIIRFFRSVLLYQAGGV